MLVFVHFKKKQLKNRDRNFLHVVPVVKTLKCLFSHIKTRPTLEKPTVTFWNFVLPDILFVHSVGSHIKGHS